MDNGRNWQGWAALLLAGLALFVALSGHLNFSFSLADGAATAVAPAQTFRIEQSTGALGDMQSSQGGATRLQGLQDELNALRDQLNAKGSAVVPPVPPTKIQIPDPPSVAVGPGVPQSGWGWHGGGPFGFFGGFGPFAGLPRLLPWLVLGLLAWWFFVRRGRGPREQPARREAPPPAPPMQGPPGVQP